MALHQKSVHKSSIQYSNSTELSIDLSRISWRKVFNGTQKNASHEEQECKYCGDKESTALNLEMHFFQEHTILEQCNKCQILLDTKTMAIHSSVRCEDSQVILKKLSGHNFGMLNGFNSAKLPL
jgi:hypothetical protein